jgi:hypothetical protein
VHAEQYLSNGSAGPVLIGGKDESCSEDHGLEVMISRTTTGAIEPTVGRLSSPDQGNLAQEATGLEPKMRDCWMVNKAAAGETE